MCVFVNVSNSADRSQKTNELPPQEEGSEWQFNKNRQTWVLKHMYDEGSVDKKLFKSLVLPYVAGLQGGAREVCRVEWMD